MPEVLNIDDTDTWPDELNHFLSENEDLIIGWECDAPKTTSAIQFDQMIYSMRKILKKYSLLGYHCTKLTDSEITHIQAHGMSLQDKGSLCVRIDELLTQELITNAVAERLRNENQADEEYRKNMLWFCFYPLYLAEQDGIERFFRSWGGEALYNSHENDLETGKILLTIGTPCIIEAIVSMQNIDDCFLPEQHIYRVYLKGKGHSITEPTGYEAFSIANLAPECILRIIKYPEKRFIELTKYNEWDELLV